MPQERIECPIPGKIVSVKIKQGSAVSEGEELFLLESMKMENPIMTPVSGTVAEVNATEGQVTESGFLLAIIDY